MSHIGSHSVSHDVTDGGRDAGRTQGVTLLQTRPDQTRVFVTSVRGVFGHLIHPSLRSVEDRPHIPAAAVPARPGMDDKQQQGWS